MQHKSLTITLYLAAALMLFNACSNTRHLKKDQLLYEGRGNVTIVNEAEVKEAKLAEKAGNEVTFFKPNGALFGTKRVLPPFGLWTYNYCKPKGDGKIARWFYKTFSSEPILVSQVNPEQRCRKIESDLFASGFFNSKAWYELDTNSRNPRKAKINYFIKIDKPFRINTILFANPDNAIDSLITAWKENMAIKPGDIFDLETIKAEKRRIASRLVEEGYYFFMPEYIQIVADTTETPFRINLLAGKSRQAPDYACRKYTIDRISVTLSGVRIDSTNKKLMPDTVFYDGIYLSGLVGYLKPEVLTRSIQFRKGELYSTSKHQGTILRMNNYGIFRYVKMRFVLQDSSSQKMNLFIDAAPRNDVSLNMEAYIESKSSGFSGPGVEATLAHANLNRGANKLQLKLTGDFEWQWGTKSENSLGTYSYNVGINSSFVFPRLVLPFNYKKQSSLLLTKTIASLGFEFMNNIQYYRMSALKLAWGYQWKRRPKITNMFSPVTINQVNLLQTTPEFDTIVNENPYVKKSFEEQYIAGIEYNFIYDNTSRHANGIYLMAGFSTSGNLIDVFKSQTGQERPYTILGNAYSQFLKATVDLRYYTNTSKQGLVFRVYTGVGYSYKNSTVMPYIEQFYSGGANSIRAFEARSLGPGSYHPEENNGIIDQTGDIRLEGNIEYRFPLSEMVKGALFIDAGNVWLLNKDANRPGAEFKINAFINQLAVGTGAGLRFDFDFFVLRTDVGLPLRKSYNDGNGNWYRSLNDIRYYSMFNLAIGYPF
jgi:outer membrane protein assembly factor BamA